MFNGVPFREEKSGAGIVSTHDGSMKRLMSVVLSAVLTGALWAQDGFWRQLTPEERAAAGLARLTPEQQAALDRLAARFAMEGARRAREEARTEALATAREETRARVGLETPPEESLIRSRIKGEFTGWRPGLTFLLENGQVWKVVDNDTRSFSLRADPEIEIRPGSLGGWKLRLLPHGLSVRVSRVK